MPLFDNHELTECLKQLVQLDRCWMDCMDEPKQFYARINHFSMDKTLGVRTPQNTKIVALLNPI
jgi:branched-subunit amino acid aminotransferase/4-amino-4-deoxychorismate lyase